MLSDTPTVMATSVILLFVLFLTDPTWAQSPQITITPDTNDITLFEGSEFRRICAVDGVSSDVTVRLEWVRDGQLIDSTEGNPQLLLFISEVDSVHSGEYMCRVILTPLSGSDPITSLGPMSGGILTVLDGSLINAPAVQVIAAGSSGSLNCSYPGGLPTWRRQDNSIFGGSFFPAVFPDEGVYTCDIYVPDSLASITVTIMLYIAVPVRIVDISTPVHHNLTSNQPVTFAVDFRGRESHDLTITWYHNTVQVPSADSRIHNSFDSLVASGRTEFRSSPAKRVDAGLYRVVISSVVGVAGQPPVFASQQEATFQIDVTVRPTVPANLFVDQISSRTARVSWRLTNQTTDEAADRLILRVTFANRSLADWQQFSGDHTSMVLDNLIPANDYFIVLTAENSDGEVSTNAVLFRTLEGSPSISSLLVERVNRTWFNVALMLAYTGGGGIATMTASYRPTAENTVPTRLASMSPDTVGLSVRGVVMLTQQLHGQLVEDDAAMELEFIITVRNEFDFDSAEVSVVVPAFVPTVIPTTPPSDSAPPSADTSILPFWLIAVIASVITILVMLVLVAIIVWVCWRCRGSNKPAPKLNVVTTVHQSMSTLSAAGSGMLHMKSLESIPVDTYRARSQSSSVPSEAYTPSSLEEHLEKKHRRELSESSSMKVPLTPSTTASNSPANFNKTLLVNSQDKGLDCINEQEASRSDDSSTESERDRMRQQQMLSQQNMRNSQYVRGHGDGSVCGSSHHSLVSSHSGMQGYPHSLSYSDPKHLYTVTPRLRVENSGMYSDCESVVSSVMSVPSNITYHQQQQQQQQQRAVQYRSPTPYNHDFGQTEESTV